MSSHYSNRTVQRWNALFFSAVFLFGLIGTLAFTVASNTFCSFLNRKWLRAHFFQSSIVARIYLKLLRSYIYMVETLKESISAFRKMRFSENFYITFCLSKSASNIIEIPWITNIKSIDTPQSNRKSNPNQSIRHLILILQQLFYDCFIVADLSSVTCFCTDSKYLRTEVEFHSDV